jgi:hypothetical protein
MNIDWDIELAEYLNKDYLKDWKRVDEGVY